MNYWNLLRKEEFEKLSQVDMRELKKLIPNLKDEEDQKEWIADNIENLNIEAQQIVKNKIFAGRFTLKLFKVNTILSVEDIKSKLQSDEVKFGIKDISSGDRISIYSTFILDSGKYIIRIKYDNGIKKILGQKMRDIKYIDVIYCLQNQIMEVRTEFKKARKIINFLNDKLNLGKIEGIRVLRSHKTIEEFASAINGHFKKILSNTSKDIKELSEDDSNALGNLILALDEFLESKDVGDFVEKLDDINFNENLSFVEAFLAGCKQIGITVNNDLSTQVFYKAISKELINDTGYIAFNSENKEITIRISSKADTNTVQFVSSVDEKIVSLIVNNIYCGQESKVSNEEEIKELYAEIKRIIKSTSIKSINPEYFINNFSLPEVVTLSILEKYVNKKIFQLKYEVTSIDGTKSLEFNTLDEIRENVDLIKENYDNEYDLIEDNDEFIDEFGEYISIKYNIDRDISFEDNEDEDYDIYNSMVSELDKVTQNNVEVSNKGILKLINIIKDKLLSIKLETSTR